MKPPSAPFPLPRVTSPLYDISRTNETQCVTISFSFSCAWIVSRLPRNWTISRNNHRYVIFDDRRFIVVHQLLHRISHSIENQREREREGEEGEITCDNRTKRSLFKNDDVAKSHATAAEFWLKRDPARGFFRSSNVGVATRTRASNGHEVCTHACRTSSMNGIDETNCEPVEPVVPEQDASQDREYTRIDVKISSPKLHPRFLSV